MSILVDANTRVVVQGITGAAGSFHARQCREYGTAVVAGVRPGKGGGRLDDIPIFDTVKSAVASTGANTSLIFVPAPQAPEAIEEAAESGVTLIVCITEGIPVRDMARVKSRLRRWPGRLVGPNGPGVITPGVGKVGIMPGYIHRPGPIGVISRSGTLTYEAVWQLSQRGLGQSTVVGIGGDPIVGTSFREVLEMFEKDTGTHALLLIGEIGGSAEEEAAEFFKGHMTKPMAAFIAGQAAPPGRRMGHAGAIIEGHSGTAQAKMAALKAAGVHVVAQPAMIGEIVERMVRRT